MPSGRLEAAVRGNAPSRALGVSSTHKARPASVDSLARFLNLTARSMRTVPGSLITGVILAASTWPVVTSFGSTGLDASFVAGLHLASRYGLQFGGDLIYAYGPLGFLGFPQPYIGATSAAAMGAYWLVHASVCVSLVSFAFRAMSVGLALVVSYVAARILGAVAMWELVLVLALYGCAELLRRDWSLRWSVLWAALLPGLASVALFGKFNVGFTALVMATVTVVVTSGRRLLPLLVACAAVVLWPVVVWIAVGQRPEGLLPFLRYSLEIAAGYSSAMGISGTADMSWQYAVAAIAVATVGSLAVASTSWLPTARRLGFLVIIGGFGFATLKAGFVRFDAHSNLVFASAFLATFAVLPRPIARSTTLLALAVTLVGLLGVARLPYTMFLQPVAPAQELLAQVGTIWDPERRAAHALATEESVRAQLAISPEVMVPLAGRTLHIDPDEASVVLAYPDVIWRPPPVFQSFSAYTPALDNLNADFYRSDRAPDVVLRLGPRAIDGRWFWWDSPEATLELVCRYTQRSALPLFYRTEDRCGEPEHLETRTIAYGEPAAIPRVTSPQALVFARVDLDRRPTDSLRTLLFRDDEWRVVFDGTREYRLIPATASGPLILSVPSNLGWVSPWIDGMPSDTLAISPVSSPDPEARVTINFYEVRLSAPPPSDGP